MILPLWVALAATTTDIPMNVAVWKHRPSGRRIADAYPEGEPDSLPRYYDIDMRCRIIDRAGHVHCILVGESPAGYGVGGKLTAELTRYGIIDMRRTPDSAVGRVVLARYHLVQD